LSSWGFEFLDGEVFFGGEFLGFFFGGFIADDSDAIKERARC